MAMGVLCAIGPAVAATAGIYFYDKTQAKAQELGSGVRISVGSMVAEGVANVEKIGGMLKLAPQFDGLYCFETFVGH